MSQKEGLKVQCLPEIIVNMGWEKYIQCRQALVLFYIIGNLSNQKHFVADINECDSIDYPCVNEATCINNVGDFECACPKGYHGNGKYFCDGKH